MSAMPKCRCYVRRRNHTVLSFSPKDFHRARTTPDGSVPCLHPRDNTGNSTLPPDPQISSECSSVSSDVNSAFNISGTASVSVTGSSSFGGSSDASLNITGSCATISYGTNLTQGAFGTLKFTLSSTGASVVNVTDTFNVNAASLLTIDGGAYAGGLGAITIVNAATITGTFGTGKYTVTGLGVEGVNWTLAQNEGSSGDLVLNIIPEPGTYALLAGLTGLVFVMLRRRA